MPQDIKGILPPEEFMLGMRYSFLQDIKNAPSYDEKKVTSGTEFTVDSKDVYRSLMARNNNIANLGAPQLTNEAYPHNLWQTIENIIATCLSINSMNPDNYLALKYLYVEADAAILDDIVPSGIRLADDTLTFRDWTVDGDSDQPFATSIDETRVILRCSLGGSIIEMDELQTWIDYKGTSDKNIVLLTYFEYQDLVATTAYNSEA